MTDAATIDGIWRAHHRVAIDVAYRLLGSLTEAEDAVQEAFARLARERVETIADPRGWLVVVVSRICLDQLGSARARRETYVGPWLPEPLVAAAGAGEDPADRVTLDESVRMALLVVLEQLTPPERVAFVLHDVFRLSFEEVGEVVGRTAAACRQLASRARRRIQADEAARFEVDPAGEAAVAERFLTALRDGDIPAITAALDPDVVMRADSGGLVQAPRRPVSGRDTIVKIVLKGFRRFPGLEISEARVNGGPGLLVRDGDGTAVALVALAISDGAVRALDLIGNPEKLARVLRRP
jgi:RNA polymerase sigma-70 factor, ECF subfamily